MPFRNGHLAPETVADQRTQRALAEIMIESGDVVRGIDLVLAGLKTGDEHIHAIFGQAMRQGTIPTLIAALQRPLATRGGTPLSRDDFAANALRALDEFGAVLRGGSGVLDSVALELFFYFVLTHLSSDEVAALPGLDVSAAAQLFRNQVAAVMDPRGNPTSADFQRPTGDAPFRLPIQIAPSDDLTWQARQAETRPEYPFDSVPLYDRVFDGLSRALHRRTQPHALLVGDRGVGKLALVSEFARRAAVGQLPYLADCQFIRIDGRHISPDETRPRLAALLAHVTDRPELVVCLDGLATLLRADRGGSNKPVLLQALSHARCRLIGLVTPREFEEVAADDPEFAELFVRVDVSEPDPDQALPLVSHFAVGLGDRYGLQVGSAAVRQAVVLSANYILNDQLPAKAVRVLTRACEEADFDRSQLNRKRDSITGDDVVRIVADLSGVPAETLRGIADRSDYAQSLGEVIYGQDQAVHEVATELGLIKAGMVDASKPASVMLFLGQTGTGKTEMAKALARFYSASKRLKTYTLGNCVEPHSVATIIGVPPGYVGSDRGGRLVNELNADPYCVVLLDEADKAHPDVLQPFLNLFDEGWVTDQRGSKAYGTKAIFILTTNVGQRMIADMFKEGKSVDEVAARMKEALSQIRHGKSDRPVFTPEFLARIKRIIVFRPLDATAMQAIARKHLNDLARAWADGRGKQVEVPEALADYVGAAAHRQDEKSGGKEGGRLVRKLVAEWIEATLQREMSRRPEEYRAARTVTVTFTHPPEILADLPFPVPAVGIRFDSA
jgi:ATP-dependent Clp protease ATP-binding subunit ClpC